MDTLQIHLFGNQKISIILVAAKLLHLLQIRKNGQSTVQNFAFAYCNMYLLLKQARHSTALLLPFKNPVANGTVGG